MRHFHLNKAALWRPVINVDSLATLIPAEQREGLTAESTVVPVIDTLAAVRFLPLPYPHLRPVH
jgi:large subunit ribosomal protein L27Ae